MSGDETFRLAALEQLTRSASYLADGRVKRAMHCMCTGVLMIDQTDDLLDDEGRKAVGALLKWLQHDLVGVD